MRERGFMSRKNVVKTTAVVAPLALAILLLAHSPRIQSQSTPQNIFWGNSVLQADQGGSIELGAPNNNSTNYGSPYIDFHFASGRAEDLNFRLINDADGVLHFFSVGFVPVAAFGPHNVEIDGGVKNSGSGIKHVRVPVSSCTVNGTFATCPLSWPGGAFADTNYTAVCSPDNAYGTAGISSKSASGITVLVSGTGNLSAIECMGMHD